MQHVSIEFLNELVKLGVGLRKIKRNRILS